MAPAKKISKKLPTCRSVTPFYLAFARLQLFIPCTVYARLRDPLAYADTVFGQYSAQFYVGNWVLKK